MKCLRKERDALLKEKEAWKSEKITPRELLDINGKKIIDAIRIKSPASLLFHFTSQCHFNWKSCERVAR